MAVLITGTRFRVLDASGNPVNNAKIHTYSAGTTTPKATYTTQAGDTPNANPVRTNSAGVATIWLGSGSYRFVVTDENDVALPDGDVDNISAPATLTDLSASSGSSLIGFIQSGGSAVARTAQAKMRETVSVTDFGATGDGTTDDTAAIVAAIAATPSGGALYIPPGTYITSSRITITAPITLYGAGYGSVIKLAASSTHIALLVEDPSFAAINGIRLENFRVDANSGGQLDAGIIALNNAVGFVVRRLWIENATRTSGSSGVNGISFSAGNTGGVGSVGVIESCYITNTSKAAINWTSESVSALISGNHITTITGNGTAPGIQVNGGFNGKIIGNDITATQGPGIYMSTDSLTNPARNAVIIGNTIRACGASSTTQGDGILITGSSATGRIIIDSNQCYDNGTNTNGGSGIYVVGHEDLIVSNNLCRNNRYDGIRLQDVTHVSVTGNRCTGNNLAAVSFAGGIHLRGTSGHVFITGNHCSDSKSVKTQSYGIILDSSATLTYLTIDDNHLEGNASGPLLANAGAKPMLIRLVAERQTTDGSAQTAQYFSLPDDCAAVIHAKAVGKKTDGTNRALYTREGLFYRDGGTATQQGSTTTLGTDIESDGTWGGVTMTTSSNLAVVQVTGLAATTIDWRAEVTAQVI